VLDVIIVGAGPAGLSAALLLGRARRRVVLCHGGPPRNHPSHALRGFLTRDGMPPREFLRIAREQLGLYASVQIRDRQVVAAERTADQFEVTLEDGSRLRSRFLLLATGVVDELPHWEGLRELYGRSVHHCPYCDGWEWRDQPIAAYGRGSEGAGLAVLLSVWSRDLVLCTDGQADLSDDDRARLARLEIAVREEPIERLEGDDGRLGRIVFRNGRPLDRSALFLHMPTHQRSDLALSLGCALDHRGGIQADEVGQTEIPGLYVAGDALKVVQLAIDAAADGARAAIGINKALLDQDLAKLNRR
jgi:thioredoxin reductase